MVDVGVCSGGMNGYFYLCEEECCLFVIRLFVKDMLYIINNEVL